MGGKHGDAGPAAGRTYHHGDLRAALLDAAEAELQECGIEGFSLRAVAKRAGVSPAAPAHHFSDVKGLLTALAAEGFRRFVLTQRQVMEEAREDPVSQLRAAGLGYVRFALANPALFRLIFSSDRPDFDDPALMAAADDAYGMLSRQVMAATRTAEGETAHAVNVTAAWSITHGLADLLVAGRLKMMKSLPAADREELILAVLERALPAATAPEN